MWHFVPPTCFDLYQGHHEEDIYKSIQVQQILSKMCICRVYLHDDDELVAVKTCRRNMRDKLSFITDCAACLI